LSPNQARNLGWQAVQTKYTVFLDNDALVSAQWLEQLVQCAEETNAWVVAPLYLIGEFEKRTIHLTEGRLHARVEQGRRVLYDEQFLFNASLDSLQEPLRRGPTDYAEFHCMLVRTDVLQRVGPLDEKLWSLHEHIDVCLGVQKAGGTVLVEPSSVVTYVPPPPGRWWDLPYFMLRWNEEWNHSSVRHFLEKWNYDRLGWVGDKGPDTEEDPVIRFGRGHRRLLTGLRATQSETEYSPASPIDQAQLIVALFLSVDRDQFELGLLDANGVAVNAEPHLNPAQVFQRVPALLQRAENDNLTAVVRPESTGKPTEPILIRLDDVPSDFLQKARPYAFLTLKTHRDLYQCWIAVDKGRGQASFSGNTYRESDMSNAVFLSGREKVGFCEGVAGLLVTAHQFDRSGIRNHVPEAGLSTSE
jgi:hypothetical protein